RTCRKLSCHQGGVHEENYEEKSRRQEQRQRQRLARTSRIPAERRRRARSFRRRARRLSGQQAGGVCERTPAYRLAVAGTLARSAATCRPQRLSLGANRRFAASARRVAGSLAALRVDIVSNVGRSSARERASGSADLQEYGFALGLGL